MRGKSDKVFKIEYTKKELREKFNIEMWSDEQIQSFQEILMGSRGRRAAHSAHA